MTLLLWLLLYGNNGEHINRYDKRLGNEKGSSQEKAFWAAEANVSNGYNH